MSDWLSVERTFIEDALIKVNISKYLNNALSSAGFSRIEIQKTPVLTRITVYVLNPGRVIGRGGKNVDMLTETIKGRFAVENPQISVMEVENKMLEPLLVAKDLAQRLERGINPRRLLYQTLRSIIESGALGAEIRLSGKLAAKGARARSMIKSVGYMPKAGDVTNLVREAITAAHPKYGAIGIRVRIVPPGTLFPDRTMKPIELPKSILSTN